MANKHVWRNTLILSVTWTISSYSFYYCEFYLRLIPTNTIYVQKMAMGFSDMAATLIFYFAATRLSVSKSFILLFGLLALSSLGLCITLGITKAEDLVELSTGLSVTLSILVIAMRIASFSSFAFNYSQVVELTPTLFTGLVFAIVNTVCRAFTILAPLIAELVPNSSWSCAVIAVGGMVMVPYLRMNTKLD